MNKYLCTLWLLVIVCSNSLNAQTWDWSRSANSNANSYGGGIDVDSYGNSYVTGSFSDSISFGSTVLINAGLNSVYIAKYDVNGALLWARVVGSATNIEVHGIYVDRSGNMSIVGMFTGSATFGTSTPVSLASVGDYDVFVARYNSAGDINWAKRAGDTGFDYGSSISGDAVGNVYINGESHISSFTGSSSKIFVAKYDSTGNCPWFKMPYDYSNFHQGNGIKTDSGGNSYFTGQFFDALTFDSTIILDAGNIESNIYIGKMNTNGTVLWLQKAGAASGYAGSNGMDIDKNGNSYITGFYRGTISFGSLSLSGPSGLSYDVFIAKCDANGDFVWVNKATGPGATDEGRRASVDDKGDCYFMGYFDVSMTFGTTTLTNTGNPDIYIAKADSNGNFIWATQCGGLGTSNIAACKANSNGVFLTGDFTGTINFGASLSLTTTGANSNIFTAKIKTGVATFVPEIPNPVFSIFPNPVNNELQLNCPGAEMRYTIYDIEGRIMDSGLVSEAKKIYVENLASGTYFIRLTGGNISETKKIVVLH